LYQFVDDKDPNTFPVCVKHYLVKIQKKSRSGEFRSFMIKETDFLAGLTWVRAKTLSGIGSGSWVRSCPG
jgi:hypothetical protein